MPMSHESILQRGVVAIDDSGTPGSVAKSRFLESDRKSWAAVLVPPTQIAAVAQFMEIFLAGVKGDYGANELHFAEIYGGRGVYKDVSLDQRYGLFVVVNQSRTLF